MEHMERATEQQLFFDPFAAEGAQFSPLDSFDYIYERYKNNEISHDYTADAFVQDVEALMLDAVFVEQFEAAALIASRMHQLCGEDHTLRSALTESGLFGGEEDNHGHEHTSADDCEDCGNHKCTCKKKRPVAK